jgi:molybdopterin molybdotransferase
MVLAVVGDVRAGSPASAAMPGAAVRVMTGASVPVGADAVVPVEWTDGGTEKVAISRQPEPGANIRLQAKDVTRGATVLQRGTVIAPVLVHIVDQIAIVDQRARWAGHL